MNTYFKPVDGTKKQLGRVGVFTDAFPRMIITVANGASTTNPPLIGRFGKIDSDGKLELSDGSNSIGLVVDSNTDLAMCGERNFNEYQSMGMVYVALKDGIDPKHGDYIKVDSTGVADIGTVTDPFIGRFLGIYGAETDETTPLKTMFVQLGGF